MKKLTFILLLWAGIASAQTTSVAQLNFGTVSDLRQQGSDTDGIMATLAGLATTSDGNGGMYRWNTTSTATDDGFVTIKVANITTGRWLRIGNGNTIKGQVTFTGIAAVTSYTVAYQQGTLPFTPIGVIINPRTSAGSYGYYIDKNTGISNTNFTVSYNPTLIGLLGALTGQSITFDYIIIKQ